MPVTNNVVSSNPDQARSILYNIMWKVFQWLVAGRWFSPGTSTKKTDPPRYNWTIVESSVNTINPLDAPNRV